MTPSDVLRQEAKRARVSADRLERMVRVIDGLCVAKQSVGEDWCEHRAQADREHCALHAPPKYGYGRARGLTDDERKLIREAVERQLHTVVNRSGQPEPVAPPVGRIALDDPDVCPDTLPGFVISVAWDGMQQHAHFEDPHEAVAWCLGILQARPPVAGVVQVDTGAVGYGIWRLLLRACDAHGVRTRIKAGRP